MIGTLLNDRFQVNERLVQRGPIELYEGLDLVEGRLVWIKRLLPPLDQELDFVENWEAQLLSVQALESAHALPIFEWGRLTEGGLYQIEAIPEGSSVRRWSAARAPMAVAESVGLIAAAARAVGLAHREGIAHGALSPENIFVEQGVAPTPTIEISGWELGEVNAARRNAGDIVADRADRYSAPEQRLRPSPPPTPAADVYALGVMLYELLTGTLPASDSANNPLPLTPPSRFNPEVPAALDRELLRALSNDSMARHPQGLSLAQALSDALAEPPTALAPTVEPAADTLVVERTPAWWPEAALLGMMALCALLFMLWYTNRDPSSALAPATPTVVSVPNLVGPPYVPYNDATILAWNRGFAVSISGFVQGEGIPDGVVVSQCPPPGTAIGQVNLLCADLVGQVAPSDHTIWVDVSSLPSPTVLRVVPDLYGQPEPEARAVLEVGGLRLGSVRTAFDSRMPEGRIVEQNPRRAVAVLAGEAVDIIVSAGPAPAIAENAPPLPTETVLVVEEAPPPTVAEVATTAPPPTAEATQPPPTAEATEIVDQGAILFEDDFEAGNVNGWVSTSSEPEDGGVIENGFFTVRLTTPELFWDSRPQQLFTDFTYEADVTFDASAAANPEASAGIIYRVEDDDHFYLFEINTQGQYRLRIRNGGEWLVEQDWTTEGVLRGAGENNRLKVTVRGERMIVYANESQLAVSDLAPDTLYLSGDIGVAVQAGQEAVNVQFDNVVVTR